MSQHPTRRTALRSVPRASAIGQTEQAGGEILNSAPESGDFVGGETGQRTALAAPQGLALGLTGPPGVGKSTLINALLARLRARGESVAVIAVDPSSRRSGGALLGDRTRIETDPEDAGVFVRSMAARRRLGGLADITYPAMVLMRALFDLVIVETVGVGQSETEIADCADLVVFCAQPGSGDALQFMKAGVMERGTVTRPDSGTPQGGVISPMLANILLHEVLDAWFEHEVRPRLKGQATLVRYADDAVMMFSEEGDAKRVLEVLPKRFGKYGLTLHPEKTKLVAFERPDRPSRWSVRRGGAGPARPETFDFLGFTFHWGKSLAGKWVVRTRTSKSRFQRTMKSITAWCRMHRHHALDDQRRALNQKLRGHYAYFGRVGNYGRLWEIYARTRATWRCWLSRRSHKARLTWPAMNRLLERYPLLKPHAPTHP